jgi:hypothetical protein
MNEESALENLQRISREAKAQRIIECEKMQNFEEEKYVVEVFECKKRIRFEVGINAVVQCVNNIQALVQLVLERLQKGILNKKTRNAMKPSVTMEELQKISNSK